MPSCSSWSGVTNSAAPAASSSRCMAPTTSSRPSRPSTRQRNGDSVCCSITSWPGRRNGAWPNGCRGPHVLVTGHPFVDVWAGIRPHVDGLDAWPDVDAGAWKEGVCRPSAADAGHVLATAAQPCQLLCRSPSGTGRGRRAVARLRQQPNELTPPPPLPPPYAGWRHAPSILRRMAQVVTRGPVSGRQPSHASASHSSSTSTRPPSARST